MVQRRDEQKADRLIGTIHELMRLAWPEEGRVPRSQLSLAVSGSECRRTCQDDEDFFVGVVDVVRMLLSPGSISQRLTPS